MNASSDHQHPVVQLSQRPLRELQFLVVTLIIGVSLNGGIVFYYLNGALSGFAAVNLLQLYIGLCLVAGLGVLPHDPSRYGLSFHRLRFNLVSGGLLGLLGLSAALLARHILSRNGYPEFALQFNLGRSLRLLLLYPINAFTQEAVTKGYFQRILISLFENVRYGTFWGIALVSLLFGQFHVFYGLPVSFGCMAFAFLTGLYYERSRSLVGVYCIHLLSGFGLLLFSGAF